MLRRTLILEQPSCGPESTVSTHLGALPTIRAAVLEAGHAVDVIILPKVEGAEDIHYADRLIAQLEAEAGLTRPILLHAILETARRCSECRGNLLGITSYARTFARTS